MTSDGQMSTIVHPRDDDIIPGKAEIVKPPSSTQDKLWSFLKTVLQFLGTLQILIGLINSCIWTEWIMEFTKQKQRRKYFEIFASGYALWGGLSFIISGIFSIVSAKISSKDLVKYSLIMSIISSLASLTGIIIIYIIVIVKQECQRDCSYIRWDYEYIIRTILEEKATSPTLENPYEDLLSQASPYDVIQPVQEEYEQYDP
ncbi:high affinity immunoglobulin epsilon receptor subunit beta-like [Macrotis lagotis]|uniref:high affinity immunoglobulin epsilon receptor subunit beta-like n=1 Tax=Macrotis lagotis TaxID=92651 RepID=UPI003D691EF3